jgi:hypothetical protein
MQVRVGHLPRQARQNAFDPLEIARARVSAGVASLRHASARDITAARCETRSFTVTVRILRVVLTAAAIGLSSLLFGVSIYATLR